MSTRRSLSTSLLTSLIKPDRTLSASEYSLLSIKRDASLASTRCRRKVRFSGKSEDQMCLILCLIFFTKKIRTPKLSELEARAIPGWVTTLGSCSVSSQEQIREGSVGPAQSGQYPATTEPVRGVTALVSYSMETHSSPVKK
ncbi:hypothetical protein L3X38_018581 [Prunus dulcis]|uniref:Uncharacterized protein n=1 Tax=Prunus dulcis TaxID=3755 RepID=A0AAD4ZB97_PRUDU|nr:hypothetical protein L3X38_018581 [Prunus dulcis]